MFERIVKLIFKKIQKCFKKKFLKLKKKNN